MKDPLDESYLSNRELSNHIIVDKVQALGFIKRWALSISLDEYNITSGCCSVSKIWSYLSKSNKESSDYNNPVSAKSSDVLIISGSINRKKAIYLKDIYEKMKKPNWVISVGTCSSSGGLYKSENVLQGISTLLPVDFYIPGCPPDEKQILEVYKLLRIRIRNGK